jgi:hypothetical protein
MGGFLSYLDISRDSMDEWSVRRKATAYTGQHSIEKKQKDTHVLKRIRIQDASVRTIKTHAPEYAAIKTGKLFFQTWTTDALNNTSGQVR